MIITPLDLARLVAYYRGWTRWWDLTDEEIVYLLSNDPNIPARK